VHLPLPVDDPKVRQPDIALATRTLGWTPAIELQRGLEETIEYFRAKLGAAGGAGR
jgi:nucleoside-diphosphate-sugar epimerase